MAVNGERSQLLLDTGGSGILINRNLVEKAGVTKLSDTDISGVGDKGNRSGYLGLANSLKIAKPELQDCTVGVLERRRAEAQHGRPHRLVTGHWHQFVSLLINMICAPPINTPVRTGL